MPQAPVNPPGKLDRSAVIDRYFLEHRAKLLDLAAFLDRCDRAPVSAATNLSSASEDFRLSALRQAINLLNDGQSDRARRILEMLSDASRDLLNHAPAQGAAGAPAPSDAAHPKPEK